VLYLNRQFPPLSGSSCLNQKYREEIRIYAGR
jgi:hypothetical protein